MGDVLFREVQYLSGWGLRGTARDRIVSLAGDRGAKLRLKVGTLLVGSERPEDLAAAINEARER